MSYSYRVTSRSVPVRTTRTTYRTPDTSRTYDPEVERTRRDFERDFERMTTQPLDTGTKWTTSRVTTDLARGDGTCYSSYETDPLTGKREFQYTFDIKGVKPEDVEVKVDGDMLTVSGEMEEKIGGSIRRQSYTRRMDIPRDVDRSGIKAVLTNLGYLQIVAPAQSKPKEAETSPIKGTAIKVTRSSDYKGEYSQTIDIGKEFADGELAVHYVDDERKLIAKGRIETQHIGRLSIREFTEEIDMDDSIDPDTIRATMDDYGKLSIKAMKK